MKSKSLKVDDEIELRACDEAYVSDIFSIVENEREFLREWLPWVDFTKEEQNTRDYMKSAHQFNIGGQQLNTWILYKGEVCGAISYVKIDKTNENGEIGYWLSQSFMGKGIMTKSCKRMIKYGFEKLGLQRVEIRVALENIPSKAIPKRLNLLHEGILRKAIKIRGKYHDLDIFSMLKEEYKD